MTTLADLDPRIALYIKKEWSPQMGYDCYRKAVNSVPSWIAMWRDGITPTEGHLRHWETDLRWKFGYLFWKTERELPNDNL